MKVTTAMVLTDNLKTLNLSHMFRQLEPLLRQAREQGLDYGDVLLSLTEIELEGRAENRLKRRLREAKFPLLKTLEMFDYHAAPGLERRLLHQLASGEYISQQRNAECVNNFETPRVRNYCSKCSVCTSLGGGLIQTAAGPGQGDWRFADKALRGRGVSGVQDLLAGGNHPTEMPYMTYMAGHASRRPDQAIRSKA
jgi:hypothetical protein